MKRLHVHTTVRDLDESIRFYSTLFGQEPARREPDYAKWMLEDPRVNFAISTRGAQAGWRRTSEAEAGSRAVFHAPRDLPTKRPAA